MKTTLIFFPNLIFLSQSYKQSCEVGVAKSYVFGPSRIWSRSCSSSFDGVRVGVVFLVLMESGVRDFFLDVQESEL